MSSIGEQKSLLENHKKVAPEKITHIFEKLSQWLLLIIVYIEHKMDEYEGFHKGLKLLIRKIINVTSDSHEGTKYTDEGQHKGDSKVTGQRKHQRVPISLRWIL